MPAVLLLTVSSIAAFGAGLSIAWWISRLNARSALNQARQRASSILTSAEEESESLREKVITDAKSTLDRERSELDSKEVALNQEREALERDKRRLKLKSDRQRKKSNNRNRRLTKKQDVLLEATQVIELLQKESKKNTRQAEKLHTEVARLSKDASQRLDRLDAQKRGLDARESRVEALTHELVHKLEGVADLTQDEARQYLREELLEKAREDIALELVELRDQVQITAKEEASKIILTTMQRLASDEAESHSVSVVPITSEDIKGRVIGREGRNVIAFEAATGVDLLVDDTPGAIVVSSFDPYRREVARTALSNLIRDGRIHPASIERFVAKAEETLTDEIHRTGERTLLDLKLRGMHKKLVSIVGKMKYRTSYGQNLLNHSIQVANLCSIMASEMGLDSRMARRAGLLHDIGKVLQESNDQPHALVGMEYCKRYREHHLICNAVGSHHDETEMTSLYAPIVQVCDAISGARPGARHIRRDEYIERLQDMEAIAMSFDGVTMAYAIQGGRELRVIVQYSKVSDEGTRELAVNISTRIQDELTYPGQVKVTVIRELRKTSVAR